MSSTEKFIMARISGPYGIKGWIKIQPLTINLNHLLDKKAWWIGDEKSSISYTIETSKIHGNTIVAKLLNIDDRDAAFGLKNKTILVPKEELPVLEKGEYYWNDLIGHTVVNQDKDNLGVVQTFLETGANDVLVVKGDKEYLVPFISHVILHVDMEKKEISVDWDKDF
ncbi:MAG: ribosome maturation factor RimM [Candidatus Methylopumilus sp.]|nr:ribosome maturation factor RimM [Candidatus Methylopumilus sp.]